MRGQLLSFVSVRFVAFYWWPRLGYSVYVHIRPFFKHICKDFQAISKQDYMLYGGVDFCNSFGVLHSAPILSIKLSS